MQADGNALLMQCTWIDCVRVHSQPPTPFIGVGQRGASPAPASGEGVLAVCASSPPRTPALSRGPPVAAAAAALLPPIEVVEGSVCNGDPDDPCTWEVGARLWARQCSVYVCVCVCEFVCVCVLRVNVL